MATHDELQYVEPKATSKLGRSKSNLWRLLIALVFLALAMLMVAPVVSNIAKFNIPAWVFLGTFMEKMAHKDLESAYSLYSPQAKEKMSLSDFEAMTQNSSFEGYKGLIVRDFHLRAAYDPKLPDFTADVEGTMFYRNKSSRPFTASLVIINDRWVLESMQIKSLPGQP
jgi:hypothetical protein